MTVSLDHSIRADEVCTLFQNAYWARTRNEEDVRRMLDGSLLLVSARREGRLIGFGRAWGDGVYRAVLDDIVVLPDERNRGVGSAILECLVRECSHVEEIALSCRSEMAPFYERHGFQRYTGAHMKRKHPPGARLACV